MARLKILNQVIDDDHLYGYACVELLSDGRSGCAHEIDPYVGNAIPDDVVLSPGEIVYVDEDAVTRKLYLPSVGQMRRDDAKEGE